MLFALLNTTIRPDKPEVKLKIWEAIVSLIIAEGIVLSLLKLVGFI